PDYGTVGGTISESKQEALLLGDGYGNLSLACKTDGGTCKTDVENAAPTSRINMAFDANQDPHSKKIRDKVSLTCQKTEGLFIGI
ncbi:hypothetical protein KI387_025384, partial [Taxus chinensis]